jgi:hypothetical protein
MSLGFVLETHANLIRDVSGIICEYARLTEFLVESDEHIREHLLGDHQMQTQRDIIHELEWLHQSVWIPEQHKFETFWNQAYKVFPDPSTPPALDRGRVHSAGHRMFPIQQ